MGEFYFVAGLIVLACGMLTQHTGGLIAGALMFVASEINGLADTIKQRQRQQERTANAIMGIIDGAVNASERDEQLYKEFCEEEKRVIEEMAKPMLHNIFDDMEDLGDGSK